MVSAGRAAPLLALAMLHAPSARAEAPRLWVDASAGAPRTASSDRVLTGAGSLRVTTPGYGADLRASTAAYTFVEGATLADVRRRDVALETRLAGPARGVSWEVRAALANARYLQATTSPGASFVDEETRFWRGALLAGVRGLWPHATARALLGIGLQREHHDAVRVAPSGARVDVDDEVRSSAWFTARVEMRLSLSERVASLRVDAAARSFAMRRDAESLEVLARGSRATTTTSRTDTERQLELSARAAIDLDALSVAGVAPVLFAGMDVVKTSGQLGDHTATAPSVGLGLIVPAGW